MIEFYQIKDFFDNLDFKVDIEKFYDQHAKSDIVITINGQKVYADAKTEVRPNNIAVFLGTAQHYHPNAYLVAAKYITPNSKESLKSNGINYIDGYGNVFLNLDSLKIFIEKGNAKPAYNVYSDVFTRAGGQILFQLLQKPELINATYEYLAEVSCVSLGTVSKTINGLLKEGFAVKLDKEKKYQLAKREELLEKWTTLFNEKILPTHKIGNYRFTAMEHSKIKDSSPDFESGWGSEYGAKLITNYLNPEKYTLFTNRSKTDLMLLFKLVPDPNGAISVYNLFWKPQSVNLMEHSGETTTSPLLIYAELIYSGKERNIETAKIIFDEHIKPNL